MTKAKRGWSFLMVLALLSALAALALQPRLADWVSILRTGTGRMAYTAAALNVREEVYALGREGDRLTVVRGDQAGRRLDRWALTAEELPERFRLGAFYPDVEDRVYLGLYTLDEAGGGEDLRLYRVSDRGRTAELLLERPCGPGSLPEQMAVLRLEGFAAHDGAVSFALVEDGETVIYQAAEAGLQEGDRYPGEGSALVLSGGGLAQGMNGSMYINGVSYHWDGRIQGNFIQAGAAIYSLDRASLEVLYTDLPSPDRYRVVMSLEKEDYRLDQVTDLSLTPSGGALVLLEGHRLLLDRGTGVTDLTGLLYRPGWQCALLLGGVALGLLALTAVLWYVLCEQRQMHLPLLVRWGGLLVLTALLAAGWVLRWNAGGQGLEEATGSLDRFACGVTALALEDTGLEDPALPGRVSGGLSAAGGLRDAAVSVYSRDEEGAWRLLHANTGEVSGTWGVLSGGFDEELAFQAEQSGTAAGLYDQDGQTRFRRTWYQKDFLLTVDLGGGALLRETEGAGRRVLGAAFGALALVTLLALAVLAWLTVWLRRLGKGMSRLSAGEASVRVEARTGDELEGLSQAFNSLAETMGDLGEEQKALARSYMRFVPEQVLALLGKQSLAEVDKQTFVSRNMSAMTVWFTYPPSVYERSGRELFDDLNQIMERTAPIVARKGGAVFNFAYNGYDAVFDGPPGEMVSTAVAVRQEILAFNHERELAGKPQVTLRIALDQGSMMIGLVGDEAQMEPTAVSSSFSVVRRLIDLCGELDANILCTEAVMAQAGDYGSRYMGKCLAGAETVRTYEIYDGDPYRLRQIKAQTAGRFSQGVYALCSRDFPGAKRIFLELVHDNPEDGGARCYLYLADQLEKHPEQEASLERGPVA